MAFVPIGPDSAQVINRPSPNRDELSLALGLAPMPAVARVLSRFDRASLGAFVAVAIDLMDLADGEPDLEHDGTENDSDGDEKGDPAFVEWTSHRTARSSAHCIVAGEEDAEQDDGDHGIEDDPQGCDPEEDMCLAGDDRIGSGSLTGASLVCEDRGPGDADDAECEQMLHDVPMLQVSTLDYNVFTDERVDLGISNLMDSFVAGGAGVRSADSGAMHCKQASCHRDVPGVPI